MFIILIAMMISWVYTYIKTYQIVRFKYTWFILCQVYLNKAYFLKSHRLLWTRHYMDNGNTMVSKGDILFVNINLKSVGGKRYTPYFPENKT